MQKMRKFLLLLTALAVLVCFCLAAVHLYRENFVFCCGGLHRRDAEQLDLRGAKLSRLDAMDRFTGLKHLDLRSTGLTKEQYDTVSQQLSECRILWDIPFQGQFLPQNSEILTLTSLTAEDVELLDHLPKLLFIDARECEEYELLRLLQQRHPKCHVVYSVTIEDKDWDFRETAMTLENADADRLLELLPYLPDVASILLTGTLPAPEELAQLQTQFPEIEIRWESDLGGVKLESSTQSVDFRKADLESTAQLEALLAWYPELTHIDLRGGVLESEDILALAAEFPHITFTWDMTIAGVTVSTDAEEIDISGHALDSVEEIEAVLPHFPNLKKVVMCGCGIDNEIMDALNQRYEDIRFVWSVYMGSILLRTDSTYFMPVKWGVQVTTEDLYNLRYCTDMVCIDIGHMEVSSCEWAAYMPNLKYLLMADTQVSDLTPLQDLKNLIYLELFLTRVTDLSPLVGCTALEDLNLCYTYGDPRPLLEIKSLKNIWWSGGWGLSAYGHQFRENNPDIRLEYSTVSSTGGGWRELPNYYDMRDLLGMGYMTG